MRGKVVISTLLVVSIVISLFVTPLLAAPNSADEYNSLAVTNILASTDVFNMKAKASVLMDSDTGNILVEKNSNEKLQLASVTKVMSMLLIMEAIDSGKLKYEDMVPVSEHSYNMGGSQVYLKPGEEFPVREMLKAVAIHSSNDATVALAEKLAGSEDVFVSLMNEKAKALGMNNTNFMDCSGLTDEGHYSSAHDIALMSRELIVKHPKILELTSVWHDTFRDGKFSLDNTNKLIRYYQGADGLKTGFTSKAGYCLSATAKRNNLRLISVVLGEPDTNTRFAETRKLLDYGFANFEVTKVNKKGEVVGVANVKKGVKKTVNAIYKDDVSVSIKKGQSSKIVKEIKLDAEVVAPIKQNQKVGEVLFKMDGNVIGKAEVVAQNDIEKASFIRLFFRMIVEWIGIGRK